MKVELKKLKVNLTFSEETIMFQCEIHVDGKRVGLVHNDGHGVRHYPMKFMKLVVEP